MLHCPQIESERPVAPLARRAATRIAEQDRDGCMALAANLLIVDAETCAVCIRPAPVFADIFHGPAQSISRQVAQTAVALR